ncbi:methylenetetrahydrofolate reductase [NAD(P)H] [Megasphaera vaginalis (ex Bordigoni et al. 2020)]|uniref:methylenetetrahydrofolate reductase [NAD(P)H] n=1 Tax=Megasphaera vaginalis (ex Bordigoni et al. 2020) TaxID=2045301 RepID=UPI000C7CD294|nr:methylenetetrahydrofolate reductase [NAD(P)H] [Megasphaera vaginalis (ex Bordigoni et al. 2020)]
MTASPSFPDRKTFSLEVFPPKAASPLEPMIAVLRELSELKPDFISVTCGANGQGGTRTAEVAEKIITDCKLTAVPHLTCLNLTAAEVLAVLNDYRQRRITNLLALRGDSVPGLEPAAVFPHAIDLIRFIKEQTGDEFNIAAACYPEGHLQATSLDDDIHYMKEKEAAGAGKFLSQLFFDNTIFYRFRERTAAAGITAPIEAGIMPVTSKSQIERMIALCGASLPQKFRRAIDAYGDDPTAMQDIGIAYAIDQIADLLANDVDGIHVYTMNNPDVTRKIKDRIQSLL